jgi:hypothetical protein
MAYVRRRTALALLFTSAILLPVLREARASCGDGISDPGEACDDGAANGQSGSCCASDCTLLPDSDNDGVCDAVDPCTNSAGGFVHRPAVRISGFKDANGADRIQTTGTLTFAATGPQHLLGFRILLTNSVGNVFEDLGVQLTRKSANTYVYGGTRGSDVAVRLHAKKNGDVQVRINDRRGPFPEAFNVFLMTFVDSATTAPNGECIEWYFGPGDCKPGAALGLFRCSSSR